MNYPIPITFDGFGLAPEPPVAVAAEALAVVAPLVFDVAVAVAVVAPVPPPAPPLVFDVAVAGAAVAAPVPSAVFVRLIVHEVATPFPSWAHDIGITSCATGHVSCVKDVRNR
jgi:hypothetical protein